MTAVLLDASQHSTVAVCRVRPEPDSNNICGHREVARTTEAAYELWLGHAHANHPRLEMAGLTMPKARAGCTVPGCDRDHRASGLCHKHYTARARHKAAC